MRFLISGYYGFQNFGDDALLHAIVAQLRTRYPLAAIDILSSTPDVTAHELRVEATPRWDAREVRKAIGRSDVVLSGGGGLLQNATSLRSLVYYAGILRAAAKAERKAMIFAQSIGPLDFWGRALVKEWCRGVDAATVRDARSLNLLRSLLPDTAVEQTADPVFLYDSEEEPVDLRSEGITDGAPLVLFSVRKAAGFKDRISLLARAADRFARTYGAYVAFLPLGGASDAEVATHVIRKCASAPVLLPQTSVARTAAIIARAHIMVGMRLHALIFAARFGVPFLAVPYDPKVTALCEDLQYPLPSLFSLDPPSPAPKASDVDALVDRVWSERPALERHLRTASTRMRALAARNFEVLDDVVRERRPSPP